MISVMTRCTLFSLVIFLLFAACESKPHTLGIVSEPKEKSYDGVIKRIQDDRYRLKERQNGWYAFNPENRISLSIEHDGVSYFRAAPEDEPVSLRVESFGREHDDTHPGIGRPVPGLCGDLKRFGLDGNCLKRVDIRYHGFTEWFDNSEKGIQHGFDVANAPLGSGSLRVVISVSGARALQDGTEITIYREKGTLMKYQGLKAYDSVGEELPATLTAEQGNIVITVDDSTAVYPITIDPWVITQKKKWVVYDFGQEAEFGSLLVLSGDWLAAAGTVNVPPYDSYLIEKKLYLFKRNSTGGNWELKKTFSKESNGAAISKMINIDLKGSLLAITHESGIFIFERDTGGSENWGLEKEISQSGVNSNYGESVSLDNDLLAVGDSYDFNGGNTAAGAVYLYGRDKGGVGNWGLIKKLIPATAIYANYFGRSVSLSGDWLAVGATGSRTIYFFNRNKGGADQWGESLLRTGSGAQTNDYFGLNISLSGDLLAVGAQNYNSSVGAVYIFYRDQGGSSNWGEVKKLLGDSQYRKFGASVSLSGELLAVGAPGNSSVNGIAKLYSRNSGGTEAWGAVTTLPKEGSYPLEFGTTVSLDGERLAISAPGESAGYVQRYGAVYVLGKNTGGDDYWGIEHKLTLRDYSDLRYPLGFGASVSLSGDWLAVGASNDDTEQVLSHGSVYLFHHDQANLNRWVFAQKIIPNDMQSYVLFGSSVSLSNDMLAVGAPGFNNNAGAVYLFHWEGPTIESWHEIKKEIPADSSPSDNFGGAVALYNDVLAVGSQGDDTGTTSNHGSVYIFTKNKGGNDNWGLEKKIFASNNAAEDKFGTSLALEGSTLAVGSPYGDAPGKINAGCAYLYSRDAGGTDQWGEIKMLYASDGTANDKFGAAISLSGSRLAVGAPADGTGTNVQHGSVYLFEKNFGGTDTWGEIKKISEPSLRKNHLFGSSLSLSGDWLAVGVTGTGSGMPGEVDIVYRDEGGAGAWGIYKIISDPDNAGYYSSSGAFGTVLAFDGDWLAIGMPSYHSGNISGIGSVYMHYRDEGWLGTFDRSKTLLPGDYDIEDKFGSNVSLSGSCLAIGSPYYDTDWIADHGAVYLFCRDAGGSNAWEMVKVFTAPELVSDDHFGISISLDGELLAVGAENSDTGSIIDHGAAYLFQRDQGGSGNWGLVKKLLAADRAPYDHFGMSVSVNGDNIAVGAYGDDEGSLIDTGSVYVFSRDQGGIGQWGQVKKITAYDHAPYDQFGFSISISGDILAVGADLADLSGDQNAGSVYLYQRDNGGSGFWGLVKKITASDHTGVSQFGYAISLSGEWLSVGAPMKNYGAVYLYNKDQGGTGAWGEFTKIQGPSNVPDFGRSVSLSGDWLAVSLQDYTNIYSREDGDPGSWVLISSIASDTYDYYSNNNVSIYFPWIAVGLPDQATKNIGSHGAAYIYFIEWKKTNGETCLSGDECASTYCTDGVCCNNSCSYPCEACSIKAGAVVDGDCSLLSAQTICRDVIGVCDLPEYCTGLSNTCPSDKRKPATTICRDAAGVCDVAEYCTGTAYYCPADAKVAASEICRAASDVCDVAEYCTGTSNDCPADLVAPVTVECHPAAGDCDLAENCDGTNKTCPADIFKASTVECRASAGVCDAPEHCTGSSAACPGDIKFGSKTTCRSLAGSCDIAEVCDAVSNDCPADVFKTASIECHTSSSVCDVAENCTGLSADCPSQDYSVTNGNKCSDGSDLTQNDICDNGTCTAELISGVCGNAIVVDVLPYTSTGDTTGRPSAITNYGLTCTSSVLTGGDIVYEITVKAGVEYQIQVTPCASFNTAINLISSCGEGQQCLGSADTGGKGEEETINYTAAQNGKIYLVIEGADADEAGSYEITIEAVEMPDENISDNDCVTDSDTTDIAATDAETTDVTLTDAETADTVKTDVSTTDAAATDDINNDEISDYDTDTDIDSVQNDVGSDDLLNDGDKLDTFIDNASSDQDVTVIKKPTNESPSACGCTVLW